MNSNAFRFAYIIQLMTRSPNVIISIILVSLFAAICTIRSRIFLVFHIFNSFMHKTKQPNSTHIFRWFVIKSNFYFRRFQAANAPLQPSVVLTSSFVAYENRMKSLNVKIMNNTEEIEKICKRVRKLYTAIHRRKSRKRINCNIFRIYWSNKYVISFFYECTTEHLCE